jgi:uncharacterized iron-regulated membrane protein
MSEPVLRRLRSLHRWIGLVLVIPLLLQAATGFILAASPPFEAMRKPLVRDPSEPARSIGAIVEAAQTEAPAGLVPSRYQAGLGPGDPAEVDLARPSQRAAEARVYVDPGSLMILDWRDQPDGFYLWVHRLHETLLLPGPLGRSVVGWFGVGLFCLGLSGISIWWPRRGRWKAALSVPPSARGYRLQRALHGAAGGWMVAFLLLQSLSGASMAFPGFFAMILRAPAAKPSTSALHWTHTIDVDAIAAAIRLAAPGATIVSIRFPVQPGRPVIANLRPTGLSQGQTDEPPIVVIADPFDGRVISVRDPRKEGPGANILAWLRALHSGEGLGFAWRAITCLLGLALPILPITGLTMWLLRRRDGRRRRAASTILTRQFPKEQANEDLRDRRAARSLGRRGVSIETPEA